MSIRDKSESTHQLKCGCHLDDYIMPTSRVKEKLVLHTQSSGQEIRNYLCTCAREYLKGGFNGVDVTCS